MADEPISALTLFTSYSTADEVEILDVSDTTFASTGTNKRIPFSTLLTMAGVATAAGVTTVAGGGTGLTAVGSADQLLGVAHTGGALEYKTLTAGPNVTITPAAGSITIASTGGGGRRWTVESHDDGRRHDLRRRKRHAGAAGDRHVGTGPYSGLRIAGMGSTRDGTTVINSVMSSELQLDHGNILERRTFRRAANGRHVPDYRVRQVRVHHQQLRRNQCMACCCNYMIPRNSVKVPNSLAIALVSVACRLPARRSASRE